MPAPASLEGSRAVVTGAGRGIGLAIAGGLIAAGARVAIIDLDPGCGADAAAALGASFHQADLGDHDAAVAAVDAAADELGGIDVLVNNAGIFRMTALLDITPEEWDTIQRVNTRSMLSTTQAAARRMIAGGTEGSIVNLASMAAKSGGAMEAAYAASKAAVVALTRATAHELGPHGIRANAVCPGYVLTDMGAATRTAEDIARWSARSPLGRLGAPEDVANLAVFLAGPTSSYLTGQAFNVTGGMITH